jgi:hypothetical protein
MISLPHIGTQEFTRNFEQDALQPLLKEHAKLHLKVANGSPSMAEERRQVREGRSKRQGTGLCEKARDESEASSARGRQQARLFLCKDDWVKKEAHIREDGQRSK